MDAALLLVPGMPVLLVLFLLAMERVEAALSEPVVRPVRPARGSGFAHAVDGPSVNPGADRRRDEEAVVVLNLVDEDVRTADAHLSG